MGMTIGVGGMTSSSSLEQLGDMTNGVADVSYAEYEARLKRVQEEMTISDIKALYVHAGTNLYYFTGTRWYPSERMVGAIIPISGDPVYIAPHFELGTLQDFCQIKGEIRCWHEHESPTELFVSILNDLGLKGSCVALDESVPFSFVAGIQSVDNATRYISAESLTSSCRMLKSADEIRLLSHAKAMTMEVHRAAARILHEGISTLEVTNFINDAHKRVGSSGSSFCIVLFGEASAFPHGVKHVQYLKPGDMVLIDTGCRLFGYHSDITRSYVFGAPTDRQRFIWEVEKQAQQVAFDAARVGVTCENVDLAARSVIESHGLGPNYELPGLPHRTGHGVGLDIHEHPYIVKGNTTPLAAGMCFSNEPMICVPGEFGVRLEDHMYMSEKGACWFTDPSPSIDDPLALE